MLVRVLANVFVFVSERTQADTLCVWVFFVFFFWGRSETFMQPPQNQLSDGVFPGKVSKWDTLLWN